MRISSLVALLSCLCLSPAAVLGAEGNKAENGEPVIPRGALYRYEDEEGQMAVSSTLTREAIEAGYQILDRQGNVIKTVEPAPTEEELEEVKAKRERQRQLERQKREDKRLLRLYAGPEDAIRARDRQLEALKLNIGYTRNNIKQVEDKLSGEISAAARFERQGKEVPESIQATIDRYQRQLSELNEEVAQYKRDMEAVRAEFEPIIKRLRALTDEPAPKADGKESVPENQTGQ